MVNNRALAARIAKRAKRADRLAAPRLRRTQWNRISRLVYRTRLKAGRLVSQAKRRARFSPDQLRQWAEGVSTKSTLAYVKRQRKWTLAGKTIREIETEMAGQKRAKPVQHYHPEVMRLMQGGSSTLFEACQTMGEYADGGIPRALIRGQAFTGKVEARDGDRVKATGRCILAVWKPIRYHANVLPG
jgi:hypothetical protein